MTRDTGCRAALGIALGLAPFSSSVLAGDIVLGPADTLAIDQPQVAFGLEDPAHPGVNVGPTGTNSAYLDTGSNGVLLAQDAFDNSEVYQYEKRLDGSTVQYNESGVGGTQTLNVTIPYNYDFQGYDSVTHAAPNVRLLASDPSDPVDLGGVAGIAGMPVMAGRVVNLDLQAISTPDNIHTTFLTALPAATKNTYHVALQMLPPVLAGTQQAGDPPPSYSAVPLVKGVTDSFVDHQNVQRTSTSTYLLDTGAQTSLISTATAKALNINYDPNSPNTDVVEVLPFGGIGTTVNVPFVTLKTLSIPTTEGSTLTLTDVEVGVLDLPGGIDGDLGMNILTSGYTDSVLSGSTTPGYFTNAAFDFTKPDTGVLALDLLPEPSSLACALAAGSIALLRRRR